MIEVQKTTAISSIRQQSPYSHRRAIKHISLIPLNQHNSTRYTVLHYTCWSLIQKNKTYKDELKRLMNGTVTNISLLLLVLLNTLQLATGVTGLFSQGVTAVVHGCSACALDPSGESLH